MRGQLLDRIPEDAGIVGQWRAGSLTAEKVAASETTRSILTASVSESDLRPVSRRIIDRCPLASHDFTSGDDMPADDAVAHDALRASLDALGVAYELFPCDPELADTAAFCAAYGFAPEDSANTILVVGKSTPPKYAACVVLATTRLDVNRALTGMEIGGVTVFGLPPDLPIWVDSRVMARERIVLGGGSRSCKVLAAPDILRALPNVEVGAGLPTGPPPRWPCLGGPRAGSARQGGPPQEPRMPDRDAPAGAVL